MNLCKTTFDIFGRYKSNDSFSSPNQKTDNNYCDTIIYLLVAIFKINSM